ncbi:Potassium channel domain [Sesbania bispinosa]|nr:Potassium channel domain [Sesbania bispinosa]
MEDEPFLGLERCDLPFTSSKSFNDVVTLQESPRPRVSEIESCTEPHRNPPLPPKKKLSRCKTAPAMVTMRDLKPKENLILTGLQVGSREGFSARDYIVDVAKGRMRIRLKVGLALGVVVLCIGIGSLVLYFVEGLDWVDSIYLSVMSVTTVGYGDRAFKTLPEARIDRRHRRMAKKVLQREITVEDLIAADINHTGFISKSEYVIFKLKEMGKIRDKDVLQICDQFMKLDPSNCGKITLPHLLEGRS